MQLGIEQPEVLAAHAGTDTLICKTHSVILGDVNTATGGTSDYTYIWYPTLFLDDITSPNPLCTPDETTVYTLSVTDAQGCTAISYVTVAVDACLGIHLENDLQDILVYPNPVFDRLFISGLPIKAGTISISLLNSLGQEIKVDHSSSSFSDTMEIQLPNEGLPKGMYLLKIITREARIIKTIQLL